MRERFETELKTLHDLVLKMGFIVERNLADAMEALRSGDLDLGERIFATDVEVDAMEQDIEDRCTMIIAREHPVAGDLRDILTVLRLSSEIERMGDHARSLAKRAGRIGRDELALALPDLDAMIAVIIPMMRDALESFASHDADRAVAVAGMDVEIDRLHDRLYQTLMNALIDRRGDANKLVPLMFLNRFLERLGDRVTNMCEWIYYARTGDRLELNSDQNM